MTPLDKLIRTEIETSGPITVGRYMQLCLAHPQHGYYQKADPLGAAGDFTTAPEISQLFGELVAVWLIDAWQQLGSPSPFALVELGPGRGTLMADIVRTAKHVPAFVKAMRIHLVETSPALRAKQVEMLDAQITHHDDLETLPAMATFWVANEFFDALPVNQWQKSPKGWHVRKIGLGPEDSLTLGLEPTPLRAPKREPADTMEGAILEHSAAQDGAVQRMATLTSKHGGAGLIIDYGSLTTGTGDTLQAVSRHKHADPLKACGEVDLTTHVDFAHMRGLLDETNLMTAATTQGNFLLNLGLLERAGKLGARASMQEQNAIINSVERLAGDAAMGQLFKVLAFASQPILLHGFAQHNSQLESANA